MTSTYLLIAYLTRKIFEILAFTVHFIILANYQKNRIILFLLPDFSFVRSALGCQVYSFSGDVPKPDWQLTVAMATNIIHHHAEILHWNKLREKGFSISLLSRRSKYLPHFNLISNLDKSYKQILLKSLPKTFYLNILSERYMCLTNFKKNTM